MVDIETLEIGQLVSALYNVLDHIQEPCNRIDFDDFDRGESAMASSILWIIHDTLGGGIALENTMV